MLKELQQLEYPLIIIKDLGMCKSKPTSKPRRVATWKCSNCDNTYDANVYSVKAGKSSLCKTCRGIAVSISCKTHGIGHENRLFRIWAGLLDRCNNTNRPCYKNYGAKGITLCEEWAKDFLVFKSWAEANDYSETLTIDKDLICEIENISPKVYSPATCIWVTRSINSKLRGMSEKAKQKLYKKLTRKEIV